MKRKALFICALIVLVSLLVSPAYAHPGRTDGQGGHLNHSTGEYHYHHGMSAHDHYDMDGDGIADCPFNFVDKTDISSGYSSSESLQKTQTITGNNNDKYEKAKKEISEEICFAILIVFPLWSAISVLIAAIVCKLFTTIFRFNDAYDTSFKIVTFVVFVAGIIIFYYYVK